LQELRALDLKELKNFSVFLTFFYIFAAIGLKLGLLLCNKELQFQFVFWCDSLIFARVTCLGLKRIEEFFSFPDFFSTGLKLGLLLCNKELQFQFAFQCDSLIFARVTCLGLRSIEEFFSFPDFFSTSLQL
jgi:hypothetical protein